MESKGMPRHANGMTKHTTRLVFRGESKRAIILGIFIPQNPALRKGTKISTEPFRQTKNPE